MGSIVTARPAAARVANTPSRDDTKSLPPPRRLTATQLRELESELRRELAALERRLINERADASAEMPQLASHDAGAAGRRASDTIARRDAVSEALARLDAGTYGICTRCAAPIPFGRLLAMPEVTHCLSCNGNP
jgi:DnaK suppressor protein